MYVGLEKKTFWKFSENIIASGTIYLKNLNLHQKTSQYSSITMCCFVIRESNYS